MVVPLLALVAEMLVGVTEKPEPLTLTVKAFVRLAPLTVIDFDTPLPVLVPTFTVEPLTGDVRVGVGVGVTPPGVHALPFMLPQMYSTSSG